MTIASLGTPASGGSSLSTPPTDARNQEKAANSECLDGPRRHDSEAPVVAPALPPPPPPRIEESVKLKRKREPYTPKVIWVSKKQRSAVVAAPGLGKVNCTPAAAAPSSPIVREQDSNKGHGAPGVDHREEVEEGKVLPCESSATDYHYGMDVMRQEDLACPLQDVQKPVKRDRHHQGVDEECWLIKKSCHSSTAAMVAVGQVNSAAPSTPSPRIQGEKAVAARRRRGRMNANPSDCKTYVSLTSGLRCLGVTNVVPVLAKILTPTDSSLSQARLQISPLELMESPLPGMLTPDEYAAVHTEAGLPVEAIDRHGCCYDMRFGSVRLSTNIAYRLKKGWTRFLTQSGVREGSLVEVGAFRAHGRLMLTLLNYASDGLIPEEMEAADGLLMLSDFKDGTKP